MKARRGRVCVGYIADHGKLDGIKLVINANACEGQERDPVFQLKYHAKIYSN